MYLYMNSRDELLRLDIENIVYFESDGNYTTIVMSNKLKNKVTCNLSKMETILADNLKEKSSIFLRIGKRFIINCNYIYNICIHKQQMVLSDCVHFAYQLPISKDALKKVKEIVIKESINN